LTLPGNSSVLCLLALLAGCATPASQTLAPALAVTLQQAPITNAAGLIGSTPAVLNAEFGPPVLLRMDGTAQVWLYHSSVCGLNLILYPDAAGTPRVAAAVPDNSDAGTCTASLQRNTVSAALERPAAS
jgi:hypothetical protein